MLAKVVSANQRDWCEHLPSVMTAYRASVHESTQFSPNRLMFGRENRLPVDLVFSEMSQPPEEGSISDFATEVRERQQADFKMVREHLGQAAKRRKDRYDDNVHFRVFQPGQLVWYFYPRKRKGLSPKWQNFYTGPYRVVRLIDTHNVVIQRSSGAKCIVVHRDKLKACFEDTSTNEVGPARRAADQPVYRPLLDEPNARLPVRTRYVCPILYTSRKFHHLRKDMTTAVTLIEWNDRKEQ